MKSLKLFVILILCAIGQYLRAQECTKPELEFACELKVTIDSIITLGQTAHGKRIIIPISGGTFEGPQIKGVVLRGGADYQYADEKNGRTELEAIYTIRTDDGVLIHVRNVGLAYTPPEIRSGQSTDFSKVYLRAAPKFEAPQSSPYNWLNNAIFICKVVGKDGYISIQVWKVL